MQAVPPDGRAELIVHLGQPYIEVTIGGEAVQPLTLFAGQLTQPLLLRSPRDANVFGVRFAIDGARGFLGGPMDKATNRRIDLREIYGVRAAQFGASMRKANAEAARAEIASDFVRDALAAADARYDRRVRTAVSAIVNKDALPENWVRSERQAQRLFSEWVGVSRRMLKSILRFRRVFDVLEAHAGGLWVGAALQAGYFDQPQMVRDFQRFLGCTPRAWAKGRGALSKALVGHEMSG